MDSSNQNHKIFKFTHGVVLISPKIAKEDEDDDIKEFIDQYFQLKIIQDYENQEVMEDLEKENDTGNHEYKFTLSRIKGTPFLN